MIQGRDFLEVADSLIVGDMEAEWRSAVSRAYYAAFHVARDLLAACGFDVPRGDRAHAYLWLRLANCGHAETQSAGNDLNNLRGERNRADYDLHRTTSQSAASYQLRAAKEIIQLLDAAAADAVKRQITETIKTYEHNVLKEPTWRA